MNDRNQARGDVLLAANDLAPDLMEGLDRAAAGAGIGERSAMIRRILAEWLHQKGYMRGRGCDEGTRPEDLTSENDI